MTADVKRITTEVSTDSYLDHLAHGHRAGYIRSVIDAHLEELASILDAMTNRHGSVIVAEAIDLGSQPARAVAAHLDELEFFGLDRDRLAALWAESEATGLDGAALIALLQSGRCV
jgi:hypothetical protein